jgi:hypothetical protein
LTRASDGLEKLRRVQALDVVTQSLTAWMQILDDCPTWVLEALTSRESWAVELRQNSPFTTVLTVDDRLGALAAFRDHWRRTAVT